MNVTYIIGAGASAGVLPLVKGIPSRDIEGISDAFRRVSMQLESLKGNGKYHELLGYLFDGLEWLANKSEEYNTVDTFAYECYLNNRKDLQKMKFLLVSYFIIDQFVNKKLDHRYTEFLETIITPDKYLPQGIKIINWNYDFQFQIAASKYGYMQIHRQGYGTHLSQFLNYYPKTESIAYLGGDLPMDYDMVQMNGIAGFYIDQLAVLANDLFLKDVDPGRVLEFLNNLLEKGFDHLITFAFEQQDKVRVLIKASSIATYFATRTNILVVIGYSFPEYNRQEDTEIFKTLNEFHLNNIYYQNPLIDGQFLRNMFNLNEKIKITWVSDVQKFFVPPELTCFK